MIYTYDELLNTYGSQYKVNKIINDGKVNRIQRGFYSDTIYNDELDLISKKYPNAIISKDSAYYFHNLTNRIPDKIFLSTDRDASKIKDNNIKQVFSNSKLLNIGVMEMTLNNVRINIYDKERMLCELVKDRNKIPFDYYKELTKSYEEIIDDIDFLKVTEYLKYYKNGDKLFEVIQREVV